MNTSHSQNRTYQYCVPLSRGERKPKAQERGNRSDARPLVKYPQKIGDFELCEWDNNEELDHCQKCKNIPDKLYVRLCSDNHTTGDYYCYTCAIEEVELIEDI